MRNGPIVKNDIKKFSLEDLLNQLHTREGREVVEDLLSQLHTEEGREIVEDLLNQLHTREGREVVEDLLSQLHTEESKTLALYFLIDKGIIKDKKYNYLDSYKKANRFYIAAKIAEEEGKFEEAIELYIKTNHFSEAARLEEERGNYDKAIKLYERDLFFEPIMRLLSKKSKGCEMMIETYKKIDTLLMLDEVFVEL